MPQQTFARPDYETRIAMERNQRENEQLRTQFAAQQRELAALKLERIEAEVESTLSQLAAEGYTVVPEVDRLHLCRLDKPARELAVKFMRDTRAKAAPAAPGGGRFAINPGELLQPVKFERVTEAMMPGDPALTGTTSVPDDYDALVRMRNEAARTGQNLKTMFDIPTGANGVKVR